VDAARDYQTPKASQQRRSGKRSANPGAEWSKAGFRNNRQQRVPHKPTGACGPEQKIEKAKPGSRAGVENTHQRLNGAKAEQRCGNKAEGQCRERNTQSQQDSCRGRVEKADPRVVEKQVGETQKNLHEDDAHDWPEFQTNAPCGKKAAPPPMPAFIRCAEARS